MIKAILWAGALISSAFAARVSYAGSQVVRCNPTTRAQLDFLHNLEETNDLNLDFWLEARNLNKPVDIMVSGNNFMSLKAILREQGLSCDTMLADVEGAIAKQQSERKAGSSFFDDYQDWQTVQAYIEGLAAEFPSLASVSEIGKTYLGKPQKIITMSTDPSANKPALWFDGGLHAREWVTISTVTYLADAILRGYGKNSNSTYILDTYDVVICPILNVDGYDYTWTTDRMWRKTRSPNNNPACVGTDPNRNWEFHWGEAGASPVSCSDSYQGPYAASEIEVQNVQNYLYDHKSTLVGFINFHSYSQEWMSPWGYTDALPADYETQNDLSAAAVAAIKATHGKDYIYGPIATTIYPASGSSADYTYGVCGIVYSYGVELRDTGEFGFLLPPKEIIPSGEEIFSAILAMAQFIDSA